MIFIFSFNYINFLHSQYFAGKNLDKDLYGDDLDRIISTNRFVPDKGFISAEPGAGRSAGPVQVIFFVSYLNTGPIVIDSFLLIYFDIVTM